MAIDPRWYEASWRDPCVVWNPADKQYWMAICSRTKSDGNNSMTGCVALATSPDLATWTIAPPLWAPQFSTWLECPDLFPCGDKWVLLYYWRQTQVRLADSPLGPWLRPPVESPNSWNCVAAKTMWDGKRRIQIGCLPRRPCYCGAPTGGCTFLMPREWHLSSDNVPSTRPAAEVIATYAKDPTEGRAAQVFAPSMSDWDIHGDTAVAAATPNRSAMALWRDAPANYYLRATLRFEPGSSATFLIRGQSADSAYGRKTPTDTGYQLILEPDQRLVSLRRWYEWNQRGPINEMPYAFSKDRGTVVEIFLDGDIIEVFLDGRSSLVGRLPENITGSLALLARDGKVIFEGVRVRTL
jgi:beta-fructofuranosidase